MVLLRIQDKSPKDRRPAEALCRKEELRLLILEMIELPMVPVLVDRVLRVPAHGSSRMAELAEIISADKAITGNILRIANSVYFGLSQQVSALPRAIELIGYEGVKGLALSELISGNVDSKAAGGLFDSHKFMTHSLACAHISKRIAAMTHRADRATTFVCGLMHDIGKAFLTMYFPDSYGIILINLATGERTSIQSENDVFGFTHTEVGAWLAQRWGFSKPVVSAIANHHGMPEGEQNQSSLASILHLADHICLQEKVSVEKRGFVKPLEGTVLEQLRLDGADVLELRRVLGEDKAGLQSLI